MNVFDVITLFGGLAMFLYGMRIMGNGLKEGSSGALKVALEKVTNNPIKAFFLGLLVTAIIQSSTATIVITAGLVGAGLIRLKQSLGIIIGANVGTTVTGQIIRLLDVDSSKTAWLQVFKPSTLAPIALVIGIILIMFLNFKNSDTVGTIAVGFGILFSGLLNMTGAVDQLSGAGAFEGLFASLGSNHLLGYVTGAGVAFILQSSSATIGILQAFSMAGQLTFNSVYAVIVGIYLGDCVTTAIVCSIGAKAEARRVGIVNILFNLSETVLVLVVVGVLHKIGVLDSFWDKVINSGGIANTNTIFNLGCAICLFPLIGVYEKLSYKIIREKPAPVGPYDDKIQALNPAFFSTPALALNSCYDILGTMYELATSGLNKSLDMLSAFDEKVFEEVSEGENNIDILMDNVSNYLAALSPHLSADNHIKIFNQYCKDTTEFERLGDHAQNIAELARDAAEAKATFSPEAFAELEVIRELLNRILENSGNAFLHRDIAAARSVEPMEEVVDDITGSLKDNHLTRLREGKCGIVSGTIFLDLLSNLERISDICSNIALATIARVDAEAINAHGYVRALQDETDFEESYHAVYKEFYGKLENIKPISTDPNTGV